MEEPRSRVFERGEDFSWTDIPGFVVLLDADLNEVVEREDCRFDWGAVSEGALYRVTTSHQFDIRRKAISFMAVGATNQRIEGSDLMFISPVVGRPVQGSVTMFVGPADVGI